MQRQRVTQPARALWSNFDSHGDEFHPVFCLIHEQRLTAETIPLGAVARRTEREIPLAAECFRGGAGGRRSAPACRYRTVLGEAADAFFTALDRDSVRDLVDRNPELPGFVVADPP